jgi:hypothetical protein
MISLHRTGPLATLLTLTALLAGAHSARANDPDVRATTIPATACQPATSADASRAALANGAWFFNGTAIGTLVFYCPLPINGNTEFDASNDNDMTVSRIFYRDTDGMGGGAEIVVRLLFRTPALSAVGAAWSSNSSAVVVDTTAFHPVAHDMPNVALYSFEVRLTRTSTVENPVFYGIDFP